VEIDIISEHEITVYSSPERKVRQRVITYKTPEMAPRTIWLDSVKLPDAKYQIDNPGKTPPPDLQALGDAIRKKAIEADIKKFTSLPPPRRL